MSPRGRSSPDDPREWLNRAKSNLALAWVEYGSHIAGTYIPVHPASTSSRQNVNMRLGSMRQ